MHCTRGSPGAAQLDVVRFLEPFIVHALPMLSDPQHEMHRQVRTSRGYGRWGTPRAFDSSLINEPAGTQGVAEALFHIVQALDTRVVPYAVILIIPLMGRMRCGGKRGGSG